MPQLAEQKIAAVVVPDAAAVLPLLLSAFYEDPASVLTDIAVCGARRSTRAVSYLVRSILEATGQVAALLTPHAFEVGGSYLTPRGELWAPEADDPTRDRACTTPGWLAPYRGKYDAPGEEGRPDALQLQQLLAGAVDAGAESAVLDVSLPQLAAGHLAGSHFDVAVFAGGLGAEGAFTPQEGLDSWQAQVDAAASLFTALDDPATQRAVICADDVAAEQIAAAAAAGAKVLTFSGETVEDAAPFADVYPITLDLSIWDTALTLHTPAGELTLRSALVGRTAVRDIAAAVAVGVALAVPLDVIAAGVEALTAVPGQLESVDEGQPFAVIVDEARSVAEVERTLQAVRDCGAQHVIAVLGVPAATDKAVRPALGQAAHRMSDVLIVTSDDPDEEDELSLMADAVAGFDQEVYRSTEVRVCLHAHATACCASAR